MPVHRGQDSASGKCYYQWGNHGKKYYYEKGDTQSRNDARKKADRQGYAVTFKTSTRDLGK